MTVANQAKHLIILILSSLASLFWLLAAPDVRADPVVLRTALLELNPTVPAESRIGRLTYLGGLIIAGGEAPGFGGYSGMAVDADGAGLWAIADTGHWLRLDFRRDEASLPTGIASARILSLRDAGGETIRRKVLSDAESLRHLSDGRWLVSFERAHRLWFYDRPGGVATGTLMVPESLARQPDNGGIEAVAAFASGDLLLLSEEMPALYAEGSAAWLWRNGVWRDLAWPAHDGFKPTDAVALENGDALVLERYYMPLIGPKARLQRIPAASLAAEDSLLQPELLAEWAAPYSVDNMEALDARRMPDGSVWLYVMSDDNQNHLQRTLLMVFRYQP